MAEKRKVEFDSHFSAAGKDDNDDFDDPKKNKKINMVITTVNLIIRKKGKVSQMERKDNLK